MRNGYNFLFWIGVGITLYGVAYFLIHDIFIHQRFRIFRNSDLLYFKAIRRAHKMHHKHLTKEDGECFGMLWVPLKYLREAKNKKSPMRKTRVAIKNN
jgi:beta-carotene 3-hydroxylase